MKSPRVLMRDAVGKVRHTCALMLHRAVVAGAHRVDWCSPSRAGDTSPAVLVVKPDNLGDFILFSAILPAIRRYAGERRLVVVCGSAVAGLVSSLLPGIFDEVIIFDRERYRHRPTYRLDLLTRLRRGGFEAAIHPVYSREIVGEEITLCSGASERVAFLGDTSNMPSWALGWNNRFYSRLIPTPGDGGRELRRYWLFGEALNGDRSGVRRWPRFEPPPLPVWLEGLLPERFYAICPGAFAAYRCWPAARYGRLVRWVYQRYRLVAVLCGTAEEARSARAIADDAGVPVVSLCGRTTLSDLAALFRRAVFCIGSESGAIHLAAAVGVPTVCIIGGGHFGRFFPWVEEGEDGATPPAPQLVVSSKMECFGCNWRCVYPRPRCVEMVGLERVRAVVEGLLGRLGVFPFRRLPTARGVRAGTGLGA